MSSSTRYIYILRARLICARRGLIIKIVNTRERRYVKETLMLKEKQVCCIRKKKNKIKIKTTILELYTMRLLSNFSYPCIPSFSTPFFLPQRDANNKDLHGYYSSPNSKNRSLYLPPSVALECTVQHRGHKNALQRDAR